MIIKAYRIYYIHEEYIPSDYYDEDGYCDDYYDDWREEEITVKYVDSKEKAEKFIEENQDEYYYYEEINIE